MGQEGRGCGRCRGLVGQAGPGSSAVAENWDRRQLLGGAELRIGAAGGVFLPGGAEATGR